MTRYKITHATTYTYPQEASESFAEARICPRNHPHQKLFSRALQVDPIAPVDVHVDYFGNHVDSVAIPSRHKSLFMESTSEVGVESQTHDYEGMDVSVTESRMILKGGRIEHFDFLAPTQLVPAGPEFISYVRHLLPGAKPIGQAIRDVTAYLYRHLVYETGATAVTTHALDVSRIGKGVCQDFAHLMLAIFRSAGLPCRYVSGYIETAQALHAVQMGLPDLIGSAATHAWVEVLVPGGEWVGADPTNNLLVSDRHIVAAVGRDYADVPPIRGAYRGAASKSLAVTVRVERLQG